MKTRPGGKPKLFITAWGEEKTALGWQDDRRVNISKQTIRNRYYTYLQDLEEEREPPRYASTEDVLTRPLVPYGERKRRAVTRNKNRPVTNWDRQVFNPLRAFLAAMPGGES